MDNVPRESSWTRPHRTCRHPEFWHAPDSDSTEEEVGELIAALATALQPEIVVETGSAFGYTTQKIGNALKRNGHGTCYSLEIDQERAHDAFNRCVDLPVRIIPESSLEYEPPGHIDLLFSDSDYLIRRKEIERFRRWMSPSTIVAIHDTTSGERGHHVNMRREVQELERKGILKAVYLPTPRGLAICQVIY